MAGGERPLYMLPHGICGEPEGRAVCALWVFWWGAPRTIQEDWGRGEIRGEFQGGEILLLLVSRFISNAGVVCQSSQIFQTVHCIEQKSQRQGQQTAEAKT